MQDILGIVNQKGGVGKTTTAAALSVLLARDGHRIHLVDVDPQASLTSVFNKRDPAGLLYQALAERDALPVEPITDNLTLTPSTIDLAKGEGQFMTEPAREFILKTSLEKTDLPARTLVILDCPPSLGVLALNCLTAATKLLVVVQPGGFELRALAHLQETVEIIKERMNPGLEIVGAVLTNCHVRRAITDQVQNEISRLYTPLGLVRSDAQLLYATTEGRLLDLTTSNALEDYADVARKLKEKVLCEKQLAA